MYIAVTVTRKDCNAMLYCSVVICDSNKYTRADCAPNGFPTNSNHAQHLYILPLVRSRFEFRGCSQ
jgi:hypothetical protein